MEEECEECLGELFSAQKVKIEEVQEKLKELDRIHKEEVALLQNHLDDTTKFLKDLRDFSRWTWGMTYRDCIYKFLKDRGI